MNTFISYKFGDDRNKYENVCYGLDQAGIKYWSTQEIAAGLSLRDELQAAIRECSVCIFVATEKSLASDWCQAEIGAFWGLDRPVVVYLAEDPPTKLKMPEQFTGDKFATTIREVVEAVKVHLSKAAGPAPAEAVSLLACGAFVDKLNLQFKTNWFLGFGSSKPSLSGKEPGRSMRSTNAFGEQVVSDTGKPGAAAAQEFSLLVKKIADLHVRRRREITSTLLGLFAQVQGQAQSVSRLLGKIAFGPATLAAPWQQAQDSLSVLWETKSKELDCFNPGELDRLRQFLSEHPGYQQAQVQDKETMEAFLRPGLLSLDELLEMTAEQLPQFMKAGMGAH